MISSSRQYCRYTGFALPPSRGRSTTSVFYQQLDTPLARSAKLTDPASSSETAMTLNNHIFQPLGQNGISIRLSSNVKHPSARQDSQRLPGSLRSDHTRIGNYFPIVSLRQ